MSKISKITEPASADISGQAMDRRVEKQMPVGRYVGYGVAALLAIAFIWWLADTLLGGRQPERKGTTNYGLDRNRGHI